MKKIGKDKYLDTFLKADVVNKNCRTYPKELFHNITKQFKNKKHDMLGELGHPDGSSDGTLINLGNVSHKIVNVFTTTDKLPRKKKKKFKKLGFYKKDKHILYGEIQLLKSPSGNIAKKIIDEINGLVVRPRGVGILNRNNEVETGYEVLSFDLISKAEDSFNGII